MVLFVVLLVSIKQDECHWIYCFGKFSGVFLLRFYKTPYVHIIFHKNLKFDKIRL